MRIIALLSLMFRFIEMMILDGQPFSHAVIGVIFDVAAIGCGFASSQKNQTNTQYQ